MIEKIYGKMKMTWQLVIILAVTTALLTALFLIIPVFKNTSFERMGVYLEAWFLFAIIIMSNCKTPVESAMKTFVFFLISQPLIYLLQVPFNPLGFGVFMYYKTWFIYTLLTIPMAYIGWYITKKNWLSVLLLVPVLAFMGMTALESGTFCLRHFPHLLLTTLFCIAQIVLYVLAFMPESKQKIVGIMVPVVVAIVMNFMTPKVDVNGAVFLPNDLALSEEATLIMETDTSIQVSIERTGSDSMIRIQTKEYGTADFVIHDGDQDYRYTVEVYEDDAGHSQTRVSER